METTLTYSRCSKTARSNKYQPKHRRLTTRSVENGLRGIALRVVLTSLLLVLYGTGISSYAQSEGDSDTHKTALKAQVIISAPQQSRVGEVIKVIAQVKNVGSIPFYVTRAIQMFDYHGGFELVVTPPPGAKVQGGAAAGDYFGKADITKETQDLVLLVPGAIYGGTISMIAVPNSPGTYKLQAKRVPPLIPDTVKEELRSTLKFPMLLDTVESNSISIIVTK